MPQPTHRGYIANMKSTKTNQNQGSQLINHKELNRGTVGPCLFELMTFSLRFVQE